jgi:20S proteasome alpha/beta subunit
MTEEERAVLDAALKVVDADTYKHPMLSRDDAVKAGVECLYDAVERYRAAQPAMSAVGREDIP